MIYNKAKEEVKAFEIYKQKRYYPMSFIESDSTKLVEDNGTEIVIGPPLEKTEGKDYLRARIHSIY
jgi:hypothetical protein